MNTENLSFVILNDKSAIEAAEIVAKTGLRGDGCFGGSGSKRI
ncbi:MAG TPA: hypothetical protein ACFYDZ_01280 [Candidatus Brocadiaceae bacterium]